MSVIKTEHVGHVVRRSLSRPNKALIRKYLGEAMS